MITIEKETLKELLREAYEAGWYGSLELCDAEIERLEKKAEEKAKPCTSEILASFPKLDLNYTYPAYALAPEQPFIIQTSGSTNYSNMHWQEVGDG